MVCTRLTSVLLRMSCTKRANKSGENQTGLWSRIHKHNRTTCDGCPPSQYRLCIPYHPTGRMRQRPCSHHPGCCSCAPTSMCLHRYAVYGQREVLPAVVRDSRAHPIFGLARRRKPGRCRRVSANAITTCSWCRNHCQIYNFNCSSSQNRNKPHAQS